MFNKNQPKENMFTRDAMIKGIAKATAKDKAKKTKAKKETMTTSIQYKNNMHSNAKTDDLFRQIRDLDNQWFAFDFILDHFNEDQKVKIRKYIKDLIKEEKTNN